MKSFKEYVNTEAVEPQMDFDDPSVAAGYNSAMPDAQRWPPKPKAKYDAAKRKWRVGKEGRKPESIAKEQ